MAVIVKNVLTGVLDGQLCELVFHMSDSSGVLTEAAINDIINDNMMFPLAFMQSNEVTWTGITTQKLTPTLQDPVTRPLAFPGQVDSPAAPSVIAMVASMRTGLGGRKNRGRKYLFGHPENGIDGSFFTAAALANAVAKWGQIHDAFGVGNTTSALTYGILHRYVGGVHIPPAVDQFVPCTSVIPHNYVATMRSRRPPTI
jgi:hypothetical protein